MSREAMQMALEALEKVTKHFTRTPSTLMDSEARVEAHNAITALRQALETEREPVAWASNLDFDDDDQEIIPAKDKGKLGTSNCDIPLYITPKRWIGLTDEEVSNVIDDVLEGGGWLDVARAIEQALKEKNA